MLHNKICSKPDVATVMDQYIQEQMENGNYIKINPSEAHSNSHQLHFVGYNYVFSSTSSSTKVRMTTDSSMCTESGLSLNGITKPAPGVVPSLQGILLRSRCHVFYSVFDIKKKCCSVRISDRDSYLRIVCVLSHPSPSRPLPPLPGPFSAITLSPLATANQEIMWHAPKLQLCSSIYLMSLLSFKKPSIKH